MNTVVTVLAALFTLLAVIRLPVALRAHEARASYLTVVFSAPGLFLLNTEVVHWMIIQAPWAAGGIRVAPFLLAVFAPWSLGEAAVQVTSGRKLARASMLEPAAWCVVVLVLFAFVKLDPLAEVFTIVHATQLPGLLYTLVYYTAAAWFALRVTYRTLRTRRRWVGYTLLAPCGCSRTRATLT